MEQTQNRKMPCEVWLSIDFGTTSTKAAVSVADPASPGEAVNYLLEFPSSDSTMRQKYTQDLDTTLVFTNGGESFSFGSDGLSYLNTHVFRDWKLGLMGVEPFASNLAETCRQLQQFQRHFTPASLLRILFEYILKTAKEHIRKKYGESVETIKAWLTYPVSCGEPIRVLLLQEANAAGIDVMGACSESLSAAFYVEQFLETKGMVSLCGDASLPGDARLILDFGGATVDATILYKSKEGQLVQACASDGHPQGGQMVNEKARLWLKEKFKDWKSLWDDNDWALFVSPFFDRCKRAFDGRADLKMYRGDGHVTIPRDAMIEFFTPLISGAVNLAKRMCDRAREAGHLVKIAVASGGTVENEWFAAELFKRLQQDCEIARCEKFEDHGIVARGALHYARLHYARSTLVEEHVITRNLGLTYIGDYTIKGEPLKSGEWWRGIGWILREGQDPNKRPECLKFTKKIKPHSTEDGDLLIESEMHVTPPDSTRFSEKYITRNDLIQWECDITYPATKRVFSLLSHLGTFSGKIPHDILFPPETEAEEREFAFELTLEVDRQLLRGVFAVVLPNGERHSLRDVIYTALPLVPRSEYLNHLGQFNPGVKRGADDENVDDRPATRHSDLSPSRISVSSTPSDSIEHSPSDSSGPSSPDQPPNLPPVLPPVRQRSRPVTADLPDLPANGPSAFLRSRLASVPNIPYAPGFKPPDQALRAIKGWSQRLSGGSRERGADITV